MSWSTSSRRAQLPADWAKRRDAVAQRAAGQCQAVIDGQRCPAPGTDCDHINRTGTHELDNLQWLCHPHHQAKTNAEARAAKPTTVNRNQPHPGLAQAPDSTDGATT